MNVLKLNYFVIYSICLSLSLFFGCSKNDVTDFEKSDIPLQLKLKKELFADAGPRPPEYSFSYGVFMLAAGDTSIYQSLERNREFQYDEGSMNSTLIGNTIYHPHNSAIDIIAYAPYKANVSRLYPVDVTDQSDLEAIDLLYTNSLKNINKQNGPLELEFQHQLSKVNFNLIKSSTSDIVLDSVRIELIGFYSTAYFNLLPGTFSNRTLSPSAIALDKKREAIVIPNSNLAGKKFKLKLGHMEWEYELPTSDNFESGYNYYYNITITDKKIDVERTNIGNWISNSSGIDDTGLISTNPIEYAYIPAGTFQMGAPDTANTTLDIEKPQHWVRMSKSFYMSKHEITVSQYAEFLNAIGVAYNLNPRIYHNIDNESTYLFYSKKESTPYFENNSWVVMPAIRNYPMQGVTWHGALAYAKWKGATLPTEAQWEYAYRATTKNKFFTGNFGSEMMAYGYYHQNTGGYVKSVGEKLPNPWGLYDIAGNVLEWCLDGPENNEIVAYPVADNELSPIIDPVGKVSNTGYAYYRGGNYYATVQLASAYCRNSIQKEYSAWQIGFRIVINP